MATAIEYGGHFGLPGIPAGSVVHVTLKGSKPIGPVTLLGYQPGAGVSLTEDGGRVVLANAGHEPPLLRHRDGHFTAFPADAPPEPPTRSGTSPRS